MKPESLEELYLRFQRWLLWVARFKDIYPIVAIIDCKRSVSALRTPGLALTLLLFDLAASGSPSIGQQPADPEPAPEEQVVERSISVEIATRSGKAPRQLSSDDVVLSLGEETIELLDIGALSSRQPAPLIVLYFDYSLSRTGPIQRVADALRERADALVGFGAVEVVVADPEARTILPASKDVSFLVQALDRIFVSGQGANSLSERRQSFLEEIARRPESSAERAAESFSDEISMLRSQQDELLRWLSERGQNAGSGNLLIILNEALGADPLDFYLGHAADDSILAPLITHLPPIAEVVATANAYGWSVFPVSSVTEGDGGAFQYNPTEDTPVGFRLRFGGNRSERSDEPGEEHGFEPTPDRWRALAAGTGGRVATSLEELDDLVTRLDARFLLRFATGPSSSAPLRLTLKDRGLKVLAPNRAPGANPEAVSEVRIRRALDGDLGHTELEVSSRLAVDALRQGSSGTVDARVETVVNLVTDEGEIVPFYGPWRFTVGVHTQDEDTITRHEIVAPEENTDNDRLRHESPLVLPPGSDSAVVVVENLRTGQWGASYVDFVDALEDRETDIARSQPVRPLRLAPLDGRYQRGRVLFRTDTSSEVSRVVFLLNGKRVARRNRAPFEARINLGDSGRTLQLVAVAYDRAGNEMDRDRLVINEPPESFWVRIVEPEPGGRNVGPTDVEARLKVPQSGRIERVDFYWNERLLASATEPPYRRQVLIPVGDPEGFLRAEARLVDGRTAEDVLVMNRLGFGEQIGVELVELYLVASDRDGKPVLGLSASDFRVLEDKKEQKIESFEVAGDLPLTVGLAIDTSSSLFLRMPAVQRAAQTFVDALDARRDRAFLVGFGSEPRLVRSTTSDLAGIKEGIRGLEPYGSTAVWGALGMSLEQLDGLTGRKALVVFYDGDDEDAESRFERSLRLARRSRVPIYIVLVNNEAARTHGRSLSSRAFVSKLDRIARAGGGRVFYVSTEQNLDDIFEQISEELRSHYLLTYYPILEPGGPQWRPVDVEVGLRGVTARTIEGRGVDW